MSLYIPLTFGTSAAYTLLIMAENIRKRRKEDALALAQLIYDIFKESQDVSAKIENGQNNAQKQSDNN